MFDKQGCRKEVLGLEKWYGAEEKRLCDLANPDDGV